MGNLTSDDVVRTVPGEDRELLKLAARAAGIDMVNQPYRDSITVPIDSLRGRDWNPLRDDGDALRLAVKLRLSIMLSAPGEERPVVQASADDGGDYCTAFAMEPLGNDPAAATRRAIVRAAAAIAKATP